MYLKKYTKHSSLFIVVMLFLSLTLLSSCDSNKKVSNLKNIEYTYDLRDESLSYLSKTIDLYETEDNGYGFWNEEINTPDMYSTFYSVKILEKIGYKFNKPEINSYQLNDIIGFTSLFDLAQYCELFKEEINKNELLKQEIYNKTILLRNDKDLFRMNQELEETDTLSNLCAVKILTYCKVNYDYNDILVWIDEYLNASEDNYSSLSFYYSDIYNISEMLKLIPSKSDTLNTYANKYIDEFQLEIEQQMYDGKLDLLTFDVYFNILKDFNINSKISKQKIAEYINSLQNENGGYGYTKGSQTDLQVTYLITKICDYYNFDYDLDSIVNLIMRHQLITTNWFITTTIMASNLDSSYYAFSILKENGRDINKEIEEYLTTHPDYKSELYYYALEAYCGKKIDIASLEAIINDTVTNLKEEFDESLLRKLFFIINIPEVSQNISLETKKSIKDVTKKYFNKNDIQYVSKFYLISLYNIVGSDSKSINYLTKTLDDLLDEYPCSIEALYGAIIALESSDDLKVNLNSELSNDKFLNWCEYVLSETDHGNSIFCYQDGIDKFADFKSMYFGIYALNRIKDFLK